MQRFQRAALAVGFVWALSLAAAARPCSADVRLPHIFGDHMVLQRDLPVRIWGMADPDEKVTVSIGDKRADATADAHGKWKVELPALAAGGGPVVVKVSGKNAIKLRDVLVGEVWVCSGQSNMQLTVRQGANAQAEIASADHPEIRLYTVPMKPAAEPVDDRDGSWQKCSPNSIGGFSAVAYYFGRYVNHELGVPVGLINTSWGGTLIEPWTPPSGFQAVPALDSVLPKMKEQIASLRKKDAEAIDQIAKWLPIAQKAKEAGEKIPAPPVWPPNVDHTVPTRLYNGMIHPLVPFAIRGALWYQGESNSGDGMLYYEKMKALIAGWRAEWKEGDFPFYFVQLASFNYGGKGNSRLAKLWEAQTATLTVPNTGMAVINDVSEYYDIHPKNKQDVGKRLALWALAKTYGKEGLVYSGPMYKSMAVEGSKIRLKFDHVGGGLVARDGKPLCCFAIAGEDKNFVDAVATIDGDSIVVSSPKVEKPTAVRFAWDASLEPNLSNKEGLPASAFRTDRW